MKTNQLIWVRRGNPIYNLRHFWHLRHFSHYEDGCIICANDSFMVEQATSMIKWEYYSLEEPEDYAKEW